MSTSVTIGPFILLYFWVIVLRVYFSCGPQWADVGCLGNRVLCQVPATTVAGQAATSGKVAICLGHSKRAVPLISAYRY